MKIIFERTLYGTSTNYLFINIYSVFSRPNYVTVRKVMAVGWAEVVLHGAFHHIFAHKHFLTKKVFHRSGIEFLANIGRTLPKKVFAVPARNIASDTMTYDNPSFADRHYVRIIVSVILRLLVFVYLPIGNYLSTPEKVLFNFGLITLS